MTNVFRKLDFGHTNAPEVQANAFIHIQLTNTTYTIYAAIMPFAGSQAAM